MHVFSRFKCRVVLDIVVAVCVFADVDLVDDVDVVDVVDVVDAVDAVDVIDVAAVVDVNDDIAALQITQAATRPQTAAFYL